MLSLWWREIIRFYRQPSRIVGGLGSPLVFWLLIGAGLGDSFRHLVEGNEVRYIEYFFPGTLALILLFTAIFSTVSLIEDRREGFLQAVLVSPVPRAAVVLSKVLGGTTLATIQGMLFLAIAPLAGIQLSVAAVLVALVFAVLVAFAMTCLGFLVAWPMESTQGFHAVMNLFLIPLWLLSGALFPAEGAAAPLAWVIRCNPLHYGVEGLRQSLAVATGGESVGFLLLCLLITILFGAAALAASVFAASRRAGGAR